MLKIFLYLLLIDIILTEKSYHYCKPETKEVKCYHGSCQVLNNSESELNCVCDKGWSGSECEHCGGRISLQAGRGGVIVEAHNDYLVDTKCSWLIQGNASQSSRPAPLRLRFHEFATECSWDHLYIYDGDSIHSPLVAVYSGLLLNKTFGHAKTIPEITLKSGSAFLHFYSDAAYNMSGFNITYSVGGCPLDCSEHGECDMDTSACRCHGDWTGPGCDVPMCPNNCSNHACQDTTSLTLNRESEKSCSCPNGLVGIDCSIPSTKGHWEQVKTISETGLHGRASHKTVLIGGDIWVIGGYDFNEANYQNIARFNIERSAWEVVTPASGSIQPRPRYGHTVALYEGNIVMYGGVIGNTLTDELWLYELATNEWVPVDHDLIKHEHKHSEWRAVVGHTAHVIDGVMYVIFGHSPIYGYMNSVQECNMSTFVFKQVSTRGAVVKGGYGHVSVYDPRDKRILVHGGFHSRSASEYHLSNQLYSYEPKKQTWKILQSSGQAFHPQYLHSAVLTDGLMLVFAGNTHNDSSKSRGAKCFSNLAIAYDLDCDRWYGLDSPLLSEDASRFGHSAVVHVQDDTLHNTTQYNMYVHAGFMGRMRTDLLMYTPGNCRDHSNNKNSCLTSREGVKCVWAHDPGAGRQWCMQRSDAMLQGDSQIIFTPAPGECADPETPDAATTKRECEALAHCSSCLVTSYACEWCAGNKSGKCLAQGQCNASSEKKQTVVRDVAVCYADQGAQNNACSKLHNCRACQTDESCIWKQTEKKCDRNSAGSPRAVYSCAESCYTHSACENCTGGGCMWCSSEQRCVEPNAYVVSFPYGQCMEWVTMKSKCAVTRCEDLRTCSECQENPACGWCDDGNNNGIGQCMRGALKGPVFANNNSINAQQCPHDRWHFADCPLCQCNGHSECAPGSDQCKACGDLTTGAQCQHCRNGYYGNPKNGRNCTACSCSGQADTCNHENGSCYCNSKGVVGDSCNECQEDHKYIDYPDRGWGCYYELKTDYAYTFNMSKPDDRYLRFIDFMATPNDPDRDVEFQINCSDSAYMNLTLRTKDGEEVRLENQDCLLFNTKFSKKTFQFGRKANTTFYVNVFDFETPFWLVISFSQFPQIDLIQFFVTFFSCFLSLLAIAAVLWKVKQRYDRYRAIQRMKVERQQWANRPFAMQRIALCDSDDCEENLQLMAEHKQHPPDPQPPSNPTHTNHKHRARSKKPQPNFIALEPMCSYKSAVVSVVMQMPFGDHPHTPPGVSGISIGTSLILLGNSQKALLETLKTEKERMIQKQGGKTTNSQSCPENIV